jgi:LPS-assembly protein
VTAYSRYVSDRTFLRRYDISADDRLRSSVNLERIVQFYFSLAGWAVQAIRVNDVQGLVPAAWITATAMTCPASAASSRSRSTRWP